MKALRLLIAAALLASPAQAQFTGSSTLNGGTANPPIPDLSMCQKPGPIRNVWYFDNSASSSGQTGATGHPYVSLQSLTTSVGGVGPLLTTAGGSVIAPGDEVLVNTGSGSYGALTFTNINNSTAFLTIAAAPGQTPLLSTINLQGSSLFAFYNLSLQDASSAATLFVVGGTAHDVIFDHGIGFGASNATVATWLPSDWIASSPQAFAIGDDHPGASALTTCVRITHNHFFNVNNAFQVHADHSRVADNELDHFINDGVDYGANNIIIQDNYIHDFINNGTGGHVDGMQGFTLAFGANDVLINRNIVVFQADVNLPFATDATAPRAVLSVSPASGGSGYVVGNTITLASDTSSHSGAAVITVTSVSGGAVTGASVSTLGLYSNLSTAPSATAAPQASTSGSGTGATFNLTYFVNIQYHEGIGLGNNDWTRLVITNNIVVFPNISIGIGSTHDSLVAGNTVLPAIAYFNQLVLSSTGGNISISTLASGGLPTTNTVVRNNYMAYISIAAPSTFTDHNVMSMASTGANSNLVNGSGFFGNVPGVHTNGAFGGFNLVDTGGIASELVQFDNDPTSPTFGYDFHLKSGAPAIGYGTTTTPTPDVDIDGILRAPTHDVGAHVFQ